MQNLGAQTKIIMVFSKVAYFVSQNPTSVNLRTVNRVTFPTNVNLGAGHRRKTVDVGFGKDWGRV